MCPLKVTERLLKMVRNYFGHMIFYFWANGRLRLRHLIKIMGHPTRVSRSAPKTATSIMSNEDQQRWEISMFPFGGVVAHVKMPDDSDMARPPTPPPKSESGHFQFHHFMW